MIFNKKNTGYVILIVMVIMALQISVFAQQKKCMFISTSTPEEANDTPLVTELSKTYYVEVYTPEDVESGFVDSTFMHTFDFLFVSETLGSSSLSWFRGAPIPLFTTELWGSKRKALGWTPKDWNPDYFGSTGETENVVKILDGDHPLAAGIATGTEVEVVAVNTGENALTYSRPEVDCIKIAELVADPTQIIVMGVEAGTQLWNGFDIMDDPNDVQENRAAAVGIYNGGNHLITEDGWKLIQAGIDWITEGATSVDGEGSLQPGQFLLTQNYPNPFNPTTSIKFTLQKSEKVSLKVFDISGCEVATLVDAQEKAPGTYTVTFDAGDLTSGIYFYKMQSESFSDTKRMLLIK